MLDLYKFFNDSSPNDNLHSKTIDSKLKIDGISSVLVSSKSNNVDQIRSTLLLNYCINNIKSNDEINVLWIAAKPFSRKMASLLSSCKVTQLERFKFKFVPTFEQFAEFLSSIHLLFDGEKNNNLQHYSIIVVDGLTDFCDANQVQMHHARLLSLLDASLEFLKTKNPETLMLIGDSNVYNQMVVEYHIPLTLTISQTSLSNYFRITTKTSTSGSSSSSSSSGGNSFNNSQKIIHANHNTTTTTSGSKLSQIDPNLCIQFALNAQDQSQIELNSVQFTLPQEEPQHHHEQQSQQQQQNDEGFENEI